MPKTSRPCRQDVGAEKVDIPNSIRPLREISVLTIKENDPLDFTEELLAFNKNMVSIGYIRITIERHQEGFTVDARSEMCDQYVPVASAKISNMSLPYSEYESRICRDRSMPKEPQHLRTDPEDIKTDIWHDPKVGEHNIVRSSSRKILESTMYSKSERILPKLTKGSSENLVKDDVHFFSEEESEEGIFGNEEDLQELQHDYPVEIHSPVKPIKLSRPVENKQSIDESMSLDDVEPLMNNLCPEKICIEENKAICLDKKPCTPKHVNKSDPFIYFDKTFFKRTLVEEKLKARINKTETTAPKIEKKTSEDETERDTTPINKFQSHSHENSEEELKLHVEMDEEVVLTETKDEQSTRITTDPLVLLRLRGFSNGKFDTSDLEENLFHQSPDFSVIPVKSLSVASTQKELDNSGPTREAVDNLSVNRILEEVELTGVSNEIVAQRLSEAQKETQNVEHKMESIQTAEHPDNQDLRQPDPCEHQRWIQMKPCRRHANQVKVCEKENEIEQPEDQFEEKPSPFQADNASADNESLIVSQISSDYSADVSIYSGVSHREKVSKKRKAEQKKKLKKDAKSEADTKNHTLKDTKADADYSCRSILDKHHVCRGIKFRTPKPCPPVSEICTKYFRKKIKPEKLKQESINDRIATMIGAELQGEILPLHFVPEDEEYQLDQSPFVAQEPSLQVIEEFAKIREEDKEEIENEEEDDSTEDSEMTDQFASLNDVSNTTELIGDNEMLPEDYMSEHFLVDHKVLFKSRLKPVGSFKTLSPPCYNWRDHIKSDQTDLFKKWVNNTTTKVCPIKTLDRDEVTKVVDDKIKKCSALQNRLIKKIDNLTAILDKEEDIEKEQDRTEEEMQQFGKVDHSQSTFPTMVSGETEVASASKYKSTPSVHKSSKTVAKSYGLDGKSSSVQKVRSMGHKPSPRKLKGDSIYSKTELGETGKEEEKHPEISLKKKPCCKGVKCFCKKSEKTVKNDEFSPGYPHEPNFFNVQQVYYFEVIHDKELKQRGIEQTQKNNNSKLRKIRKRKKKSILIKKDPCAKSKQKKWWQNRHIIKGICLSDTSEDEMENPDITDISFLLPKESTINRVYSKSVKSMGKAKLGLLKKKRLKNKMSKENDNELEEESSAETGTKSSVVKKVRSKKSKAKSCLDTSSSGFSGDEEINEMIAKAMKKLKMLEEWKLPKTTCTGLVQKRSVCPLYEKLKKRKDTHKVSILSKADIVKDGVDSMFDEILREEWGELDHYYDFPLIGEMDTSEDLTESKTSEPVSKEEEKESKGYMEEKTLKKISQPSKKRKLDKKHVKLEGDKSDSNRSLALKEENKAIKSEYTEIEGEKERKEEEYDAATLISAELIEAKSQDFEQKEILVSEKSYFGEEMTASSLGMESLKSLIKEKKSMTGKLAEKYEKICSRPQVENRVATKIDYKQKFLEKMKETCDERKKKKLCFLDTCKYKALHKTCSQMIQDQIDKIMQEYYDELALMSDEDLNENNLRIYRKPTKKGQPLPWLSISQAGLSRASSFSGITDKIRRKHQEPFDRHSKRKKKPRSAPEESNLGKKADKTKGTQLQKDESDFECFRKLYPHLTADSIRKLISSKGGNIELMQHKRRIMTKRVRKVHEDPCYIPGKESTLEYDLDICDDYLLEEEYLGESQEDLGEYISDEPFQQDSSETIKEEQRVEIVPKDLEISRVPERKRMDKRSILRGLMSPFWGEHAGEGFFQIFPPFEDYLVPEGGLLMKKYTGQYGYSDLKDVHIDVKCKIHHVCRKNPCKIHICFSRLKLCSGQPDKKQTIGEAETKDDFSYKKKPSVSQKASEHSLKKVTLEVDQPIMKEYSTDKGPKSVTSFFGKTIILSLLALVKDNYSVLRERRYEYEDRYNGRWENLLHTIRTRGILYFLHTPIFVSTEPKIQKYHADLDQDIITESANLMLMRKIALSNFRGKFRALAQRVDGQVAECVYSVGPRVIRMIRNKQVLLLKVTRFLSHPDRQATKAFTILTSEGRMVKCWWNDSPYQLITNPRYFLNEEAFCDRPIPLKMYKDNAEIREFFLEGVRTRTLKYQEYLKRHPKVMMMIHRYVRYVLLQKPENVVPFTLCYFSALAGVFKSGIPSHLLK